MADPSRLYVQTLGQELPPQDTAAPSLFAEKVGRLARMIDDADAVAVGIGSGMSTACGYDFYHGTELFEERLGAFGRAHGFSTLFDGLYHVFSTPEEQWAFNLAVSGLVEGLPLGAPYERLASLLEGKEHFVITTNVDGQVPRAFGPGRVWLFQGDLRYLQCVQPCHGAVYPWREAAAAALESVATGPDGVPRVDGEALPRCPECNWLMAPWARDVNFCEGDMWRGQKEAYEGFLRRHLVEGSGRVLFLELGVSSMTPAIIKMPFWSMLAKNPRSTYACVNLGEESAPPIGAERSLTLTADIGAVVDALWASRGRYAAVR
ncbi:MAG: Sir2 silent information regulator family NAD-dependent deacetylase [Coriobacteriales bacterium]|nr:Sir2 silent information regulator family NAD-dependent deacetylase [Coriobacteriales bacterium]